MEHGTLGVGGIDVGGDRLHVVVLDRARCVSDAFVETPERVDEVIRRLRTNGVTRVGIDAPDAASTGLHAHDESLSPKFRSARCGEIALGRERAIWVSWATPVEGPFAGWVENGFALHRAARAAGIDAVEVYPHAAFRVLAGGRRLPSKLTPDGVNARVEILRSARVDGGAFVPMWSHDALDAAVAAVVAADPQATAVTCGHDGSAIWLPSPTTVPA